ncbi:hypothetical protein H0H92_009316 [Tricholoma furcatifolium]|nr:hypothetical protein H0H92_009316 [Tricholoma furcatifolium]
MFTGLTKKTGWYYTILIGGPDSQNDGKVSIARESNGASFGQIHDGEAEKKAKGSTSAPSNPKSLQVSADDALLANASSPKKQPGSAAFSFSPQPPLHLLSFTPVCVE